MVMKAGATMHDKNMVRKLHNQGNSNEFIARYLSLRQEHVDAIVKQIKEGTLHTTGGGKVATTDEGAAADAAPRPVTGKRPKKEEKSEED